MFVQHSRNIRPPNHAMRLHKYLLSRQLGPTKSKSKETLHVSIRYCSFCRLVLFKCPTQATTRTRDPQIGLTPLSRPSLYCCEQATTSARACSTGLLQPLQLLGSPILGTLPLAIGTSLSFGTQARHLLLYTWFDEESLP